MPFQCPKCGLYNTGQAKNCAYCSSSLDGAKVVSALDGYPSGSPLSLSSESSCLGKMFSIGCASVIGLFVLLVLLSFMMAIVNPIPKVPSESNPIESESNSSESPDPSSPLPSNPKKSYEIEATVTVSSDGRFLIVANLNDFEWKQVEVEVNGGSFSSGYSKKFPNMKFLDMMKADLRDFTKKDGTRFNPYMMKVNRVMIEAVTPKGKKFYIGDFE